MPAEREQEGDFNRRGAAAEKAGGTQGRASLTDRNSQVKSYLGRWSFKLNIIPTRASTTFLPVPMKKISQVLFHHHHQPYSKLFLSHFFYFSSGTGFFHLFSFYLPAFLVPWILASLGEFLTFIPELENFQGMARSSCFLCMLARHSCSLIKSCKTKKAHQNVTLCMMASAFFWCSRFWMYKCIPVPWTIPTKKDLGRKSSSLTKKSSSRGLLKHPKASVPLCRPNQETGNSRLHGNVWMRRTSDNIPIIPLVSLLNCLLSCRASWKFNHSSSF